MNTNLDQRHEDIAGAVVAAFAGLGIAAALIDATGHPVLISSSLILPVLIVATARSAARSVARRIRERREDAADTLTGTAWRTQHMPGHPLDAHHRAGVS